MSLPRFRLQRRPVRRHTSATSPSAIWASRFMPRISMAPSIIIGSPSSVPSRMEFSLSASDCLTVTNTYVRKTTVLFFKTLGYTHKTNLSVHLNVVNFSLSLELRVNILSYLNVYTVETVCVEFPISLRHESRFICGRIMAFFCVYCFELLLLNIRCSYCTVDKRFFIGPIYSCKYIVNIYLKMSSASCILLDLLRTLIL